MAVPEAPFHIFKFGGTSVATPQRIRQVVDLIRAEPDTARRVVVVSAFGGVTDQLIQAIDAALERTDTHQDHLVAIRERHRASIQALADEEEQEGLFKRLEMLWSDLRELLDGVYLLRECTLRTRDAIIGMGERASAPIVAAAFRTAGLDALDLDARQLIRTDATFGEANVQFDVTQQLVQQHLHRLVPPQIAVVTGFIATTERGVVTTLGRSGSDYTATILAGALQAERVVIWTDVDGVLSADPRLVPGAFTLAQLSYREAAEMAYFGAKVLHPRTMRPLQEQRIPLLIKNTLNATAPGTLIGPESTQGGAVKAVTAIRGVALVMLEGAGMMGVPGISARAFTALAARKINVLVISQASSEQSICIGVRESDAEDAVTLLLEAFALELDRRDISRIYATPGCAVVSVVGDEMRMKPGLAGRMFSTLGDARINVLAIAQGAAETNISAVVREADARQAVRALHDSFALAHDRAHLFLLGVGVVGGALLDILATQAPVLLNAYNLDLRLIGLANTRRMAWDVDGLAFTEASTCLDASETPADLGALVQQLIDSHLERIIVVDATASETVARLYPRLLAQGIAVVTPNKRANTVEYAFYAHLQDLVRRRQVPYYYETTVGAGLPVISTVRDLVRSGDRIQRIEGVLSGTMAFVFNSMAEGRSFSEAVRLAKTQGFTEPDPREDLMGEDVARKVLTLAREIGLVVERAEVEVESLVPDALQSTPIDVFMDRLDEEDAAWRARLEAATKGGGRLQYLGRIEEGRLSVGVAVVAEASPFARLRGTDNMIVLTTARYEENPLVIQGAGAGPVVTAAGVLADIIRAAR